MKWYYVEGTDEKGRPVLVGPYNSHLQAQGVADRNDYGDAEVVDFPTSNLARATSMWKETRSREKGIKEGMRRVGHGKEDQSG